MSEQVQAADTTVAEEQVRTALRNVYDPELGMSVIELGLIRKIEFYAGSDRSHHAPHDTLLPIRPAARRASPPRR